MRHLIDFGDLTRAEWEALYQRCSDIMDHPPILWTPAVGG